MRALAQWKAMQLLRQQAVAEISSYCQLHNLSILSHNCAPFNSSITFSPSKLAFYSLFVYSSFLGKFCLWFRKNVLALSFMLLRQSEGDCKHRASLQKSQWRKSRVQVFQSSPYILYTIYYIASIICGKTDGVRQQSWVFWKENLLPNPKRAEIDFNTANCRDVCPGDGWSMMRTIARQCTTYSILLPMCKAHYTERYLRI